MSKTLNKIELLGHVGRDPEYKVTPSGKAIATFSIATNDGFKDKPVTNWHNITAFDKLAEIVNQYIRKGSNVLVNGRINYETYTDKNGVEKTATKILISDLIMLDSKEQGVQQATPQRPQLNEAPPYQENDDLPF